MPPVVEVLLLKTQSVKVAVPELKKPPPFPMALELYVNTQLVRSIVLSFSILLSLLLVVDEFPVKVQLINVVVVKERVESPPPCPVVVELPVMMQSLIVTGLLFWFKIPPPSLLVLWPLEIVRPEIVIPNPRLKIKLFLNAIK